MPPPPAPVFPAAPVGAAVLVVHARLRRLGVERGIVYGLLVVPVPVPTPAPPLVEDFDFFPGAAGWLDTGATGGPASAKCPKNAVPWNGTAGGFQSPQ